MGQACGCSEGPAQEDRIKELEQLLAAEKDDYQRLQENYDKITDETEKLLASQKNASSKLKTQIKSLEKEKKDIFKEMMKEKKKITKLDEEKSNLENRKNDMDRKLKQYRAEIQEIEQSNTSKNDSLSSRGGHNIPPSPSHSERNRNNNLQTGDDDDYKTPSPSPGPPMSEYDIEQDLNDISTWISTKTGDKKKDHKIFNKKMTELFTKRTDDHRYQIALQWQQQHNQSLIEAIERKLDGKTRGVPYRVLSGLLQTPAIVDASWIHECIYQDWQIERVADVVCCRSVRELHEIKIEYKKLYKDSLSSMLEKLAKHHSKNTMQHMFQHLCNTEQRLRNNKMQSKEKVNMIEIGKNVEWMLNTKSFKHPEKEKMAQLLCINSNDYIKILAKQYKAKSKYNEDLTVYLRSKFGLKSVAGNTLQTRVNFVENKNQFFANRIIGHGANSSKFKLHNLELINIFLSRFQTDLNQIRLQFNQQNDKDLHHFIKANGSGHTSTYFMMKICDNCKRFA